MERNNNIKEVKITDRDFDRLRDLNGLTAVVIINPLS